MIILIRPFGLCQEYRPFSLQCQVVFKFFVTINKKEKIEMYKYHKIRDLREDNELTQLECSKRLYVSKKTYERYENGERIPPIDFMERCAELYGVSIDYLCGRTDVTEPYPPKKRMSTES